MEKRNLYADDRSGAANPGGVDPNDKTKDTMDTWDDEKLAKVVLSKYGNPKTSTDIVCKHFIDAVESGKYGWFWICPNGDDCFYRSVTPAKGRIVSHPICQAEVDLRSRPLFL